MLKIGIVGLGVISDVHIKAIEKIAEAELVAVCDIDGDKKSKVPTLNFYIDIEEMLKKETLDCLHICLPHYLHVPIALLASKYGVQVFMEKPVGLNQEDIKALSNLDKQIKVGVCLQNRYNETVIKLQEVLQNQNYGKVKGCKAILTWNRPQQYYEKDPWRGTIEESGGGVMLSQAIHTIDLMYHLMGSIKWVKGFAGNLYLEKIEVEDTACAHMEFKSGAKGIFYATVTHCFNSSVEMEIVCEEAVLRIQDGKLFVYQNQEETLLAKDSVVKDGKNYYGEKHKEAIQAFYQAILKNNESYITVEESKQAVYIIDSVIESSKRGEKVYLNNK